MKLGKKGITIVEVIIAMALLIIVSTVTLTIAIQSTNTSSNVVLRFKAVNYTKDIIEVFQDVDNNNEFLDILNEELGFITDSQSENIFELANDSLIYNVTINNNTIHVLVTNKNKTHDYYEQTYRKAI